VILNRTLLVGDIIHCDNSTLRNRQWIPTFSDIHTLFAASKCNQSLLGDLAGFHLLPQIYNTSYVIGSSFDYSCYLDKVDLPVLSFSHSELAPYRLFYNKTNLALGDSASANVLAIFSNYVANDGYFESMGLAFYFTMGFSSAVHGLVRRYLPSVVLENSHQTNDSLNFNYNCVAGTVGNDSIFDFDPTASERLIKGFRCLCVHYPPNTITIAMHIRHFNEQSRSNSSQDIELDRKFSLRLREVLKERFGGLRCRLLLASDRKPTIRRLRSDAMAMGCEVHNLPRGNLSVEDNVTECFINNRWNSLCLEQGPWRNGLLQLADLQLLSYAQYFIGTGDSTYSYLIDWAACFRNWMPSPMDFISGRHGWRDFKYHITFPHQWTSPCPLEAIQRLSQSM